jgi:hypothetical protein
MDLFMGAIHGFDSTSDEKSASFTDGEGAFALRRALLRPVSSGRHIGRMASLLAVGASLPFYNVNSARVWFTA